jgi:hypothetical protein
VKNRDGSSEDTERIENAEILNYLIITVMNSCAQKYIDFEKIRSDFEEWYECDALPLEHSNWFRRNEEGEYDMLDVYSSWHAWKACYGNYNGFSK